MLTFLASLVYKVKSTLGTFNLPATAHPQLPSPSPPASPPGSEWIAVSGKALMDTHTRTDTHISPHMQFDH